LEIAASGTKKIKSYGKNFLTALFPDSLQFLEQDNLESIIIAATNNQRILDKALFKKV